MRCTVFGTGYLGATHAACMAELGHEVLGVDVDAGKVAKLSAGEVPFYEPGLAEVLRRNLDAGRLAFTTSYDEAAEFADVHFLGVGTPQRSGEFAADLTHVHAVIDTLTPLLTRPSVIIGKSTVPVGTAAELAVRAPGVEVAWNPEFLREGYGVADTLHPDRIVLGVRAASGRAEAVAREFYADLLADGVPFLVTDLATAELVKVSANAFLATKLSFINAIAEVCEAAGADVVALADALGHDERIGRRFLNAGLGFGGGCLPKDIRAFMARAGELGADHALAFLREVDTSTCAAAANSSRWRPRRAGDRCSAPTWRCSGRRSNPSPTTSATLPRSTSPGWCNCTVPSSPCTTRSALENSRRLFPTLNYATTAVEACERADVVLVLTEWSEFVEMDPDRLAEVVRTRSIVDGRNCLDREKWRSRGWRYRALGRP